MNTEKVEVSTQEQETQTEEQTYYCGLCGHVSIADPCVHLPGSK